MSMQVTECGRAITDEQPDDSSSGIDKRGTPIADFLSPSYTIYTRCPVNDGNIQFTIDPSVASLEDLGGTAPEEIVEARRRLRDAGPFHCQPWGSCPLGLLIKK